MDPRYKRLVKPIALICVLIVVTQGGMYLLRFALRTENPLVYVPSESMEPNLRVGDWCIVTGVERPEDLQIGDIIVFNIPGVPDMPWIHRIVDWTQTAGQWYFQTKGDNNRSPDNFWPYTPNGWVPFTRVTGKVIYRIPYAGYMSIFLHTPFGYALIAALIVLILALEYLRPEKRA